MIRVSVRSFFTVGWSPRLAGNQDENGNLSVEMPGDATVEHLVEKLGMAGSFASLDDLAMFVYVNGEPQNLDYRLQNGDRLDFHLPAMGG